MSSEASPYLSRRDSALRRSRRKSSLLPLPQITHSFTTSTPARGLSRAIPAPLPTPQPTKAHLPSTLKYTEDVENSTFFAFPAAGSEEDETALLAIEFRRSGSEDNKQQQEDEIQDTLFESTLVLEQRAFANRKWGQDGDRSYIGLGALIFNNLVGNAQAKDALERLEHGNRRRSSNSNKASTTVDAIQTSPYKRSASFGLSKAGETFVEYETDVRFGDDILGDHETSSSQSSSSPPPPVVHLPLLSLSSRNNIDTQQDNEVDLVLHDDPQTNRASSPEAVPSSARVSSSPPEIDNPEANEWLTKKPETEAPDYMHSIPAVDHQEVASTTISELSESSSDVEDVQVTPEETAYNQDSPAPRASEHTLSIAETQVEKVSKQVNALIARREARRMARGLAVTSALSPVAEDRSKEKSLSRTNMSSSWSISRRDFSQDSISSEKVENSEVTAPVVVASNVSSVVHNTALTMSTSSYKVASQVQDGRNVPDVNDEACEGAEAVPQNITQKQADVTMACDSPVQDNPSHTHVQQAEKTSPVSVPAGTSTYSIQDQPRRLISRRATSAEQNKDAPPQMDKATSHVEKSVPSYMRSTQSRYQQQRELGHSRKGPTVTKAKVNPSVPTRRNLSFVNAPQDAAEQTTASDTVARSRVSSVADYHRRNTVILGRTRAVSSTGSLDARPVHAPRLRTVSAPASSRTERAAPLKRKKSVDDFFERRQRDLGRIPCHETDESHLEASNTLMPTGGTSTAPPPRSSRHDDDALTVPQGFSFGQSHRNRKRPREEGRTSTLALVELRAKRPATRLRTHPAEKKAARVYPSSHNNQRYDTDSKFSEIGPALQLTESALSAQNKTLEIFSGAKTPTNAALDQEGNNSGISDSISRYLQELSDAQDSQSLHISNHSHPVDAQPRAQTIDFDHVSAAHAEEELQKTSSRLQIDDGDRNNEYAKQHRKNAEKEPLPSAHLSEDPQHIRHISTTSGHLPAGVSRRDPAAGNVRTTAKIMPFTFETSLQKSQSTFAERLATWQAREEQATRSGRPSLKPIALLEKTNAKAASNIKSSTKTEKRTMKSASFNWHSDKRARERKDWEDRLKEKEKIMAELAEIRRLEAEAIEAEEIRKMRAAQIPRAHPVPAFVRSRRVRRD